MLRKGLAACLAFGSCLAAFSASADEISPARYFLSAGREFTFHSESTSEGKANDSVYLVDWKVWSLGRDPDGAWRLVIRCDLRIKRDKGPQPAQNDDIETLLWRCRMFDDGRFFGATTMGTVRDPFRLFPKLPQSAADRETGWASTGSERDGVTFEHHLKPGDSPGGENLSITTQSRSSEDKVYGSSHEYRATFDGRRGVVTRVETKDVSGYPRSATTRGLIELAGVEDRGQAWATTFGQEADRYFSAIENYEAASAEAAQDSARCKDVLAQAKANLEKAQSGITTLVFLAAIKKKLAEHDQGASRVIAQAKNLAGRLGKSAADWEAKDLGGQTRRLSDYRGKVVVMDFWYRGCGWCMHAMPQVIRLSETFQSEPVAVLGMTIDEDDKDSRIVIDAMGITYPTIKAIGIPEKYGVTAYPTLIVIDPMGKVRKIHIGYSPRLFDELSVFIKGLIAEKPAE